MNSGRMQDLLVRGAAIILAGLWIYSPAYHGDWLWDDDILLTKNLAVQSGSLAGLVKLWFNPDGVDYFPLSYSLMWLQWPFFALQPTGYHVTTILLHIASAILLWKLLAKMKVPGAWVTAFVFTIHPVCVESVAWISETKNTLSLVLFLASCIFWVGQDDEEPGPRRERLYLLSLAFFLLAMFAKTSVVAMPVLTLLYAWWKRGTVTMQDAVRAMPMFLISLVLGIVTIQYQWGRAIGAQAFPIGGIGSRVALVGMAILFYLVSIVWPVHRLPIYPQWDIDPPQAWQFLPWLLIGAVGWWLWKNRRAALGRDAILSLGFFLLMVAPVLGFIDISYMRITWVADHFLYVPMIGPLALLISGAITWLETRREREQVFFTITASVVLVFLAINTFFHAGIFADEATLWEHAVASNDDAWLAHNRLGVIKVNRGDLDAAFRHCQRATQLRPDLGETWNHLALVLLHQGRIDKAIEVSRRAVAASSDPFIRRNLADLLLQNKFYREALEHYDYLLEAVPDNPPILHKRALALFGLGEKDTAIQEFRRVLEIDPAHKEAAESLKVAVASRDADIASGKAKPSSEATE